jgi:hypothetical protein
MNFPLLVVLIVIVLVVGSTLTIMNKACKSGYHAWCAPMSTVRHHVKLSPPPNPARTSQTDQSPRLPALITAGFRCHQAVLFHS